MSLRLFLRLTLCLFILLPSRANPLLEGVSVKRVLNPEPIELNDYVQIEVANLRKLQEAAVASRKGIALYLNGAELTNVVGQAVPTTSGLGKLTLQLKRTSDNREAWASIFWKPFAKGSHVRQVDLNVGLSGGIQAPPSDPPVFLPIAIRGQRWQTVAVWVLIAMLVGIGYIWFNTGLGRDPGPAPFRLRPYSLSRFQGMVWFVLIASSFVTIWIMTGDMETPTSSSLILLGISGGTYVAASARDTSTGNRSELTRGFLRDVAFDDSGLSLHRFQMLAWTLIVAAIFVVRVCNELAMPPLSGEMLTLMGISSATYVSAKANAVAISAGGSALPTASTPPTQAPANLLVTRLGNGGAVVQASPIPGATSYELTVEAGGVSRLDPSRPAGPYFSLTGLPVGQEVSFSMRAANAAGVGPSSVPAKTVPT